MYQYCRIGLGQGRVTLSVDNLRRQSAVGGGAGELRLGNSTANSYVYIGGLPPWYSGKLTSLALPSVVFEPRLQGEVSMRLCLLKILRKLPQIPFMPSIIFHRQVRNVVYADTEGAGVRHQRMMAYTVSTVQFSSVQYSTVQY